MAKKYTKSLFIFRRDLRLTDNTGLIKACTESETVIPCFIFDPRQVGPQNEYRSANSIQFMLESLEDLASQLKKHAGKLYFFYGQADLEIKKLIKHENIEALYTNRDYTPFSIKRDETLEGACAQSKIAFEQTDDLLLHSPEEIKSGSGKPYSVFTAFFKNSYKLPVADPAHLKDAHFYTKQIADSYSTEIFGKIIKKINPDIASHGGTAEGIAILKNLESFREYTTIRDIPALDATTHLSAHLKFGTISIRQAYHAMGKILGYGHPLLRQLFWRDFFTHVAYHSAFVFGHAFHTKYDSLPWENDKKKFAAWCEGNTGFPIVDAGMRQLNTTGFMHNRVRMIVASFLVKDLHINWLCGEKYFAQQLVDYDPAVNNGNWQWAASTGCDAQPYFRIFNPWLQQARFDAQCEYIKKWVPELQQLTPKMIHNWYKEASPVLKDYPRPMIDHAKESALAKRIYKNAK